MRQVNDESQFTPFGLWIREYVNKKFSVTNLDYVIEDYRGKNVMMVEEKQNGGKLHTAQCLTFEVLDKALADNAPIQGYTYWGFYVVQMPRGHTFIGPGVKLNGKSVTVEQLQRHLNFEKQIVGPHMFNWRKRQNSKY